MGHVRKIKCQGKEIEGVKWQILQLRNLEGFGTRLNFSAWQWGISCHVPKRIMKTLG